ncbi:MAG: argininosuccinate lyase [Ruminococcaceae bacterium]|nr:argininosuccinate lyase [Oscillospiraceae bacterium]MBO4972047.1 argininosuccinate lyase [Clostridia bacterium]
MDKMWAGRFAKALDALADDFNSSIHFDCKMYKQDIKGSMAHAAMLGATGIISNEESEKIISTLGEILADIECGKLEFDMSSEDIHMFVEAELTKRIGDTGKRLHTARSRNDQVALDIRMYLRDEAAEIQGSLHKLIEAIKNKASENVYTIMPGYTHLQRGQPISFAHHLLAYAMMFMRDCTRISDAVARMNYSPLGSCALAGTTYATDRRMVASALGFDGVTVNSIDGVSDRDFCVELMSAMSLIMTHLSRFSEEIILWASWEFKFIELDDSFTTGSSIMPQKKNPDIAELVRGKTGRVYGDLMALLTTLKGLPLAYNKDMQEDKEAVFDSIETVKKCLEVFTPMLEGIKPLKDNMYRAAEGGFINATDLADYLVKKGLPFRSAYKTVGTIVGYAINANETLLSIPIEKYKEFSDLFCEDLYKEISLETCVEKRISEGGTGFEQIKKQIEYVEDFLNND